MRPLRIALVHPFCWPEVRRGGERYLHDLAWYLSNAGHDVHVITGTHGRSSTSTTDGVTFHRHHHRTRVPGLGRRVPEVEGFGLVAFAALVRRRFDLVHALMPTAAVGARMTGHPVVYTVIGHPTDAYFRERAPRHRLIFRAAVRLATETTALSSSAADAIRDVTGRLPHVLPPGVRLDRFPPVLTPRTGRPVILFPADASESWKGLDVVLAAVTRLLEGRPDVRLQLGGPGDPSWVTTEPGPRGLAAAGARALTVTDVLGVGDLDDMPRRYGAANVTVLTSINEAFGLVLAESLACGTPVVGSAEGGIPDVIRSPDIGRMVPWGDVDSLAQALDETIELSRDPSTARRCVDHAERWGWQRAIGPAHERLYEAAVASRPRRRGRGPRAADYR